MGWAIYDAPAGGNMIAYGVLFATHDLAAGDIFRFPAGYCGFGVD